MAEPLLIASPVVTYCTEEVWRQGHDVYHPEGIQRVAWMLNGWMYAIEQCARMPGIADVVILGQRVEWVKTTRGIRTCEVTVGGRVCPAYHTVPSLLAEWQRWLTTGVREPLDAYRRLLEIHPFVDGNGRTGKIILNWLNGTLLAPIFPPSDFWGHEIRNP